MKAKYYLIFLGVFIIGIFVYLIIRPNLTIYFEMDKLKKPNLEVPRGKELIERTKEEWKITFNYFLKTNDKFDLQKHKTDLIKEGVHILVIPEVQLYKEYKLNKLIDQLKYISFNDKCRETCLYELNRFNPISIEEQNR